MAFIGVRSSWLSVARNSSFRRLCRSASSRASRSLSQQPLALLRRLRSARHVAGDADHPVARRPSITTRPRSVIQTTDRRAGPRGIRLRSCRSRSASRGMALDARRGRRDGSPRSMRMSGPKRPCWEPEQRLGIGRPGHLRRSRGSTPTPPSARPPWPSAAAPRSRARPGAPASSAAVRSWTRRSSSWFACFSAACARLTFGDLALSALVQFRERPRLAEQLDEHADLRPQDVGVDRLAQVIDGADPVAAQHVARRRPRCAVRNRIGHVLRSACAA